MFIKVRAQDVHVACLRRDQSIVNVAMMGAKSRNQKSGASDSWQDRSASTFRGYLAEAVVARFYDFALPPVAVVTDYGVDLFADQETTIDLKTLSEKAKHSDLIFDSVDSFQSDIAILADIHKSYRGVEILGWATKDLFREEAKPIDYGYGPRMRMRMDWLYSPESLVDWKNKLGDTDEKNVTEHQIYGLGSLARLCKRLSKDGISGGDFSDF